MMGRVRPGIVLACAATVLATVALAAAVAFAAGNVPKITNAHATPKRFCAKTSNGCARPGTTLTFTLSTPAKVIGDIRPRSHEIWGYHEFTRRFPAGTSSIRVNDSRLTTGRWTFRLQPINSVGANGPTLIDVRVVKK